MKNKKRVFLYVRVSTQEQARDGYSIDEQIQRLRDYCKALGWVIVKIYTDAGHSGASLDRPALQDMIEDIKAGKGDSVVVYKLTGSQGLRKTPWNSLRTISLQIKLSLFP